MILKKTDWKGRRKIKGESSFRDKRGVWEELRRFSEPHARIGCDRISGMGILVQFLSCV